MPRTISVQCCFATYMSNTIQVEVLDGEDLETALNRGIEEANFGDGWKKLDYEGPIFIAAACNDASSDPGASADRIEVPHLLTERGQMQIDIPSDASTVNEPANAGSDAGTGNTSLTRTSP